MIIASPQIVPYRTDLNIGQCMTPVLADVYARYQLLKGNSVETFFPNNVAVYSSYFDRKKIDFDSSMLKHNLDTILQKVSFLGLLEPTKRYYDNEYTEWTQERYSQLLEMNYIQDGFLRFDLLAKNADFSRLNYFPENQRPLVDKELNTLREGTSRGSRWLVGYDATYGINVLGQDLKLHPNFYNPLFATIDNEQDITQICGRNILSQFVTRTFLIDSAFNQRNWTFYGHNLILNKDGERFNRKKGTYLDLGTLINEFKGKTNISDRIRYILLMSTSDDADVMKLDLDSHIKGSMTLGRKVYQITQAMKSVDNVDISFQGEIPQFYDLMDRFRFSQVFNNILLEINKIHEITGKRQQTPKDRKRFENIMQMAQPFIPNMFNYTVSNLCH